MSTEPNESTFVPDAGRALSHALITLETLGPTATAFLGEDDATWTIVGTHRGRDERPELFQFTVFAATWEDKTDLDRHLSDIGWVIHPAAAADIQRTHGWANHGPANTHTAPLQPLFTAPAPGAHSTDELTVEEHEDPVRIISKGGS